MNNTPDTTALVIPEKMPYSYFESSIALKLHHFYISLNIDEPDKYIDMIHKIKHAGPGEEVYIYLNNGGGRLDTAVQIINAMKMSQAKIITVIEAEAHSASTMIFLCGDEFIVHDNCSMMFHNFSGGMYGKGNEMKLQMDATIKWFNKLAKDIYYPFLSQTEIDNLIDGKDIWMDSDEIRKRLKKMVKAVAQMQKQAAGDETEGEVEVEIETPQKKTRKKKDA